MIQQNEADVPEMLTEPGKWLDGNRLLFNKLLKHDSGFHPEMVLSPSLCVAPWACLCDLPHGELCAACCFHKPYEKWLISERKTAPSAWLGGRPCL